MTSLSAIALGVCMLLIRVAAEAHTMCGYTDSINSSSGNLTVSADAWNPVGSGMQCVLVAANATAFNATWKWTGDADTVHAFPHVRFNARALPLLISDIASLSVKASWRFGTKAVSGASGKDADGGVANVAIDMFGDADGRHALNETMAGYEVMVWIARFGSPKPLGYAEGSVLCWTQGLAGTRTPFTLYRGTNQRGTQVFTWVSSATIENLDADLGPLLQALRGSGLLPADVKLGVVEFGSEAYSSPHEVTFSGFDYALDLRPGEAPKANGSAGQWGACPPSSSSSSAQSLRRHGAMRRQSLNAWGLAGVALALAVAC